MGKPSFDGPGCIQKISVNSENKSSISRFFSRKEIEEEKYDSLEKRGTSDISYIGDPRKSLKERDQDGKNIIPKFSSGREIKEEKDAHLEERGTLEESDSEHLLKIVDEHETENKLDGSAVAEILDHHIKPSVSPASWEAGVKSKIKREYEELVSDSNLDPDENDNLWLSQERKKVNLESGKQPIQVPNPAKKSNRKGVDDKQPTLLSFFRKK